MTGRIIVLVADRIDPKHGEISVLETAAEAERLMETLLEAGIERERLRVFSGSEIDAQISHRPVVALALDGQANAVADATQVPQADTEGTPPAADGEEAPFTPAPLSMQAREGASPLFGSFRSQAALPELLH